MMENILNFIVEDGLIMIPALFIIAEIIKSTQIVSNKYIPALMLVISLLITPLILLGGYTADNIVQAILIAGATVFSNEFIQKGKEIARGE